MKSTELLTQVDELTICNKCWCQLPVHGHKLCPGCIDLFNQHMDAEFDIHGINENNEREVLTDSSSSYEEHI